MNVLIDMNLSPQWVDVLSTHGFSAVHWSMVGRFDAPDSDLIAWARANDYVIFTHDLDFGTALAITQADKPSVIQVRTQNVTVSYLGETVISALNTYGKYLDQGALIVIDEQKHRVRILPL